VITKDIDVTIMK
jgi:serine/threonine protein kinase